MTRLSTIGMLMLGTMVLCKYYVSQQSNSMEAINGQADDLLSISFRDNQKKAYLELSETVFPKTNLLFASVLPEIDKSHLPKELEGNDVNGHTEIGNESSPSSNFENEIAEEPNVAPMEQGNSSVVFPLIISPSEKIKQKSERGNYPLDQGSTINSALEIMFPRAQ